MTAALAAIDAIDDGHATATDRALADWYDLVCQARAFIPLLALCVHGQAGDCNSCFLDWDDLMRRAEDI